MTVESMMWLFVIVFVVHEFEEIIMLKPWLSRNRAYLSDRFPKTARVIFGSYDNISTSAVAFAILEQLIILVFVVMIAVKFELYALWAGVLTGYTLHIVGHLVQFGLYRRYCPFVFTSFASIPFGMVSLYILYENGLVEFMPHAVWTLIALVLIVVNLKFAHFLAKRFEYWLQNHYLPAA